MRNCAREIILVGRKVFAIVALFVGFGFCSSASAQQAPNVGGTIRTPIPTFSAPLTLNLRAQGVVTGTAPLTIVDATFLSNGQSTPVLFTTVEQTSPGSVCISLVNRDFTFNENNRYSVSLVVTDGVRRATGNVPVVFGDGETTTPSDPACRDAASPATVSAGVDQLRGDFDGVAGELVPLTGSALPSATAYSQFEWRIGARVVATGLTTQARLDDGPNVLTLVGTLATTGQAITDTVTITVAAPNQLPIANGGGDRPQPDTDGVAGERVTLNGSASFDPDGQINSYIWSVPNRENIVTQSPTVTGVELADGPNQIALQVRDDDEGLSAPVTFVITVAAPVRNQAPTANAGSNRTVPDNDGNEGEVGVALDGSASSDPEGGVLTYSWRNSGGEEIGTGPTPRVTLTEDGENIVTLIVTDSEGLPSQPATVRINVMPAPAVVAEAGPAELLTNDEDGVAGDSVPLDGSQSTGPGPLRYQWLLGEIQIGTETAVNPVELDEGVYTVRLQVTDRYNRSSFDSIRVVVRARPTVNATAIVTAEDGEAGQIVNLSGTATDRDGGALTYQWFDRLADGEERALSPNAAQIAPRLADGAHTLRLRVTDDSDLFTEVTIPVTVATDTPDPQPPTVSAGDSQNISDTDGAVGESVNLTGSASNPEGGPLTYRWVLQDDSEAGRTLGAALALTNVRLPDGVNNVTLEVTDNTQLTTRADVVITIGAAQAPTVNAGIDQTITDTDSEAGAAVTLTGTSSNPQRVASYVWSLGANELGRGATLQTRVPVGSNTVTLRVTETGGLTATDTVQIIVGAAARAPTANAGEDQSIADEDGQAGELVSLTGTATDPDNDIATYRWLLGDTELGTTATLQARLPDGVSVVTLTVTDATGLSASDSVQITVTAPVLPIVEAGITQTIEDTDVQAGEIVQLSGSATGTIAQYQWFLGDSLLGTGQSILVRLPDGVNIVTLRATNTANLTGSATVQITVNAGVRTVLANIPGLTPNEKRLAEKLDQSCNAVLDAPAATGDVEGPTEGATARASNADRADFAQKCRGLLISRDNAALAGAMGELLGDDFAVARTQTLLFANTQYASVMDRLIALRGGAKGLSLAGLNIIVDGELIPLAELQDFAKMLLGGGASSDADSWGEKWGLWMRGNYSFGSKNEDSLSPSFDADQYALLAGLDYRLSSSTVVGAALAYGNSSVEFDPSDEGALDTESWAISLYGSLYAARNFYFDAIANVADSSYAAERNITYVDGFGLVNTDANGDTGGLTISGGMSGGYDFLIGGLTISPTIGMFYIDAQIDEFIESGAGGLNLIYDEQKFKSFTGNLGVRMTFAWNLPWGVLLPHMRADFVREFEDDVDVFGIRFAADPNAASTPPILVETENPDSSYWRLAAGFSAQFKHGVSGYVEYQRLEGFQYISFQDVSLGLRFQKSF